MLRVRGVSGPSTAIAGDAVTYRVTAFNQPNPDPAGSSKVSWLIKSGDGASLGSFARQGPALQRYLLPTILCESQGHFTCLNTYDRAQFTFGHIQLAAHTPQDNFVLFFREALAQPSGAEYFPDLTVQGGRIHRRTQTGSLAPLESAQSTTGLMNYFNATPDSVDDREAERAARMVDWTLRYPSMRDLQVAFAVRHQQRKLRLHAARPCHGGAIRPSQRRRIRVMLTNGGRTWRETPFIASMCRLCASRPRSSMASPCRSS